MEQAGQNPQGTAQARPREDSTPFLPKAELPKGGGAIRSIGERVSVNPARGTCSLSIPVSTSPGRGGFGPQLGLTYDSGAGNSPFGMGWSVPAPAIARKTDKGMPHYTDADTFVLSGSDDLVPVDEPIPDETIDGVLYHVRRYRPRVEIAFTRIERCRGDGGDTFWRTVSRDNVRSVYGRAARIADPADASRVFQWLLEEVRDDRGNVAEYEYLPEDPTTGDAVWERNRRGLPQAQRYPHRIRYCGHFLVQFEYETRPDPFSTCRPGFEVRTWQRCRRIAMYHDFPAEFGDGPNPRLVRSTDLSYDDDPAGVHLTAITQTGHLWRDGGYESESLPPIQFEYTRSRVDDTVRVVAAENLPAGVDSHAHHWVDLDGEGLSGALTQQGAAWFYKRNLGGGRLGAMERVPLQPSAIADGGSIALVDLAGDGGRALVRNGPALHGFQERTDDGDWAPFRAFASRPTVKWDDPALRQADLDGGGRTDLLFLHGEELLHHFSLGRDGFGPRTRTLLGSDEERGPVLLTADALVVIGSWQTAAWDANDTVKDSLWYAERGAPDPDNEPEPSDPQQRAAWLAAKQAGTRAVSRVDSLGRPVRSISHGGPLGLLETVTELDVEGNALSVTDPRGIVVQTQTYDLAGRPAFTHSPDSGDRWVLLDIAGVPIRAWDSRGYIDEFHLDPLRRPTRTWVTLPSTERKLVSAIWYGEAHPSGFERNLFGQDVITLDGAGMSYTMEHDFKGNLIVSRHRLTADYQQTPDWAALDQAAIAGVESQATALGLLDGEVHQSSAQFDALSRPVINVLPDGSVVTPSYNERGDLDTVKVNPIGAGQDDFYVREIDYDAKGHRQSIVYGNFLRTRYTHDPFTYRLTRVETYRSGSPGDRLQDLHYTYDPVGNVTEIRDEAQQTHFYAGQVVSPSARYEYDPLYRLAFASGREHDSLGSQPDHGDPAFSKPIPHLNDASKVRPYRQSYLYDASGNLTQVKHVAVGNTTASWTRDCTYAADSNRLLSHSRPEVGPAVFTHDAHGNMTALPHLPGALSWNEADQLSTVDLVGGVSPTTAMTPPATGSAKCCTATGAWSRSACSSATMRSIAGGSTAPRPSGAPPCMCSMTTSASR